MQKKPTQVCGKCQRIKEDCNCGRNTVMTPEVLAKLEEAFALGCTDKEACFFAGISKSTLYNFQGETVEFLERKEQLKSSPVLKARQTIMQNLDDPKIAMWFLEKKRPNEFGRYIEPEVKEVDLAIFDEETKEILKKYEDVEGDEEYD